MKALYRISDGGNLKDKLPFANKIFCLANFCDVFKDIKIFIIADNCKKSTLDELSKFNVKIIETALGNAKSWRFCADYAVKNFSENETVYFVEDDYLHLPNAPFIINEGIEIADYVTLYDHPDKYINKSEGGNPFVINNGENTKVYISKSTHWKETNSTTMTFATKVKTLKSDKSIWWAKTKISPRDFEAFNRLGGRGSLSNILFGKRRKLISSIPGYSTHIEVAFLTPLVNWQSLNKP